MRKHPSLLQNPFLVFATVGPYWALILPLAFSQTPEASPPAPQPGHSGRGPLEASGHSLKGSGQVSTQACPEPGGKGHWAGGFMSLSPVPQGGFHFRSALTSADPREEIIQDQKLQKPLWEKKWDRGTLIPKSEGDGSGGAH